MPSRVRARTRVAADPALRAVLWAGLGGVLVVAIVAFATRRSLATLVRSEPSPSGLRAYEVRQGAPTSEVAVDAVDRLTGARAPLLAVEGLDAARTPDALRVRWVSDASLRIDLAHGVVTRYRDLAFETALSPLHVRLVRQ